MITDYTESVWNMILAGFQNKINSKFASVFERTIPVNRLFSHSHNFINFGPRRTKITTRSVYTLLAVIACGFTVSCFFNRGCCQLNCTRVLGCSRWFLSGWSLSGWFPSGCSLCCCSCELLLGWRCKRSLCPRCGSCIFSCSIGATCYASHCGVTICSCVTTYVQSTNPQKSGEHGLIFYGTTVIIPSEASNKVETVSKQPKKVKFQGFRPKRPGNRYKRRKSK